VIDSRVNPKFATIEERLARIEERLRRESSSDEYPPSYLGHVARPVSMYVAEPEAEYGADFAAKKQAQVPYVRDIAAGPPIAQSEDQAELVPVPARLLRKGARHYAATIRGTSMAEVGIRDGDRVLVRYTDIPVDGAIQVVRYQGRSTLKRLREVEGRGWEMHYEDGSGKVVRLDSGDYEVQGELVAVLPGKPVPEG
jgi:SOS-response transcriptional repressor LexA